GRNIGFWNKWSENVLSNININWMGFRKYGYMFSGIMILLSIGSFFVRGFDLGVDFKGGYSYNVQFETSTDAQSIRESLTKTFGAAPVVKAVDTENTFNITTSYLVDSPDENAAKQVTEN